MWNHNTYPPPPKKNKHVTLRDNQSHYLMYIVKSDSNNCTNSRKGSSETIIRELKQRQRRRQRERHKFPYLGPVYMEASQPGKRAGSLYRDLGSPYILCKKTH